jgi:hypothetical protein
MRISAHESARRGGEVSSAHDRLGDSQAAHRVVGEAAMRMSSNPADGAE